MLFNFFFYVILQYKYLFQNQLDIKRLLHVHIIEKKWTQRTQEKLYDLKYIKTIYIRSSRSIFKNANEHFKPQKCNMM